MAARCHEPRDFDISPNFPIINFNIIGQPFHYRSLWLDAPT
jgi:hypothetical protein